LIWPVALLREQSKTGRDMIYLFLGEDTAAKDRRIAELKKKYLLSLEAEKFDYEILYGDKIDPDLFKQALIALPAVAKQRLLTIHSIHKLNSKNQDILLELIASDFKHCVLILDSDDAQKKNKFFTQLQRKAKVENFGSREKHNVFDMTKAISARRPDDALILLSEVLKDGSHPLQIMGGLVWFWGKEKGRMPPDRFKSGLIQLQEADLNIKRSRLQPEYALEVCVLKLCSLIA